ncbi:hypothetical protein A6R68_05573, partial [Neotoma lepida]
NKILEDLSTTRKSVQEEIVNKHNQLRRMVSPPGGDLLKMQWNDDAHVNAQRIANLKCGENIFRVNYPASWSHVIQSWYDEVNDFSFGSGPNPTDAVVEHYMR